jgi:hypothetical protein
MKYYSTVLKLLDMDRWTDKQRHGELFTVNAPKMSIEINNMISCTIFFVSEGMHDKF